MDKKKTFFARPSTAKIKEDKEPIVLQRGAVIAGLEALLPHQYAIIPGSLYTNPLFNKASKFLKHGETFTLRSNSVVGRTPKDLLRETIAQRSIFSYFSGYSFKPLTGPDRIPRRVPFVELLEAARIMAYGAASGADVKIEGKFKDAVKARTEGGSFSVSTPSQRQKHSRHPFEIHGIPFYFVKPEVFLIPYSFRSDLAVESKAFRKLRFTKGDSPEPSRIEYIQAHEIAAAYTVAEFYNERGNPIPARFSVFPTVSQRAVDLYLKLMNRTLLEVEEGNRKRLTQDHAEAIMWGLVQRQGYEAAFDDKALLEGRVRQYNWNHV